jgi:hypothetical protein
MGDIHVIPVNDLREHVESSSCWCAPAQDDECPLLYIHHAADMREHFEPDGAAQERQRA